MKVQLTEKFLVMSDSKSFTLYMVKEYSDKTPKGEEAKNKGLTHEVAVGYYTEFGNVLDGVIKFSLLNSNATTLEQLAKEIKEIKKEITKVVDMLDFQKWGKENE